jgi:outer membrane protein assembly factor BamB
MPCTFFAGLRCRLAVLLFMACLMPGWADWPEFRGPSGDGHAGGDASVSQGLPLVWSESQNVRWKTSIPERGWSTPVVLNGQIWLTTATLDGHDFFALCVDAGTGEIVRSEKVFHADNPEPLGNQVNCYASPSPVVEAGRVYVHFGSYGTACLDAATGKALWERRDLPCRHYRGPGSSPVLFENLLILSMDGVDVQYLVALDKQTGRTVWKTDRTAEWNDLDQNGKPTREGDFRKAYSTPLIVGFGGTWQVISAGSKAAYGYNPRTGAELWKVSHRDFTSAVRPVYWQGLAFVLTGQGQADLLAVHVDPKVRSADARIAWRRERTLCKTPSPLIVAGLLYIVGDDGTVTCVEAVSGAEVWKERIGGNYIASPVFAEGRIYLPSVQGKTTVLKAGRSYQALATNVLDTGFMASPAIAGNSLFLRSKTHLYCISTVK